nr:hypothetical protein [Mycoplasmopsis bovis]
MNSAIAQNLLSNCSKPDEFDKTAFEKHISKFANSLVIVQDAELIKVHGHTLKPGDMLNYGQKYGEFIKIKSENMTLQAENSRSNRNNSVVINDVVAQGAKKVVLCHATLVQVLSTKWRN